MARIRRVFLNRVQYFLRQVSRQLARAKATLPQSRRSYGLLAIAILLCFILQSQILGMVARSPIEAVQVAQAASPAESEAQRLERSGREHYTANQFEAAADSFQRAAEAYATQGDPVRQAMSLANLSLAYQRLGRWTEANQAIAESLTMLPPGSAETRAVGAQSALAQVLDIQGHLYLAEGKTEQALANWEKTADLYRQLDDAERLANSLINQSLALRRLGLYQRAEIVLQKVVQPQSSDVLLLEALGNDPQTELDRRLQTLPTTAAIANALRNLGETLQISGSLAQAQALLRHSLRLAEELALDDEIARSHLSLGNVTQTQAIEELRTRNLSPAEALDLLKQDLDLIDTVLAFRPLEAARTFSQQFQAALQHYQQAAEAESVVAVQAQLNRLNLLLTAQQWTEAEALVRQLAPLLDDLPPDPATVEANINLAKRLMTLARGKQSSPALTQFNRPQQSAGERLAIAHQQAVALGDVRLDSYALGILGTVYEQNQQYAEAEVVTKQALQKIRASTAEIAQNINYAEIIYRWQWQLGRIHKAQGNPEAAIAAYNDAIATLTQLRQDIVTSNLPYRFSFRNTVEEPLYFEFIDLLLADENPEQKNLERSREIIALLNQAELTNFLQEPCEVVTPQQTDEVVNNTARTTAVFYPVLLRDRFEIILKLPQEKELIHYRSPVSQAESTSLIETLQRDLEEDYTFKAVQANAQKLYDWIIAPAQAELEEANIDTLVFSLTGPLQKIPMSVLYDGENYLIKRYAIAEILGLQLDNPIPLERKEVNILAAGLAEVSEKLPGEIRANFAPIPNVIDELAVIETSSLPTRTTSGEQFTQQNFNALINAEQFSIIHLATHGQFSSDPQETFLLTAPDNDNNGKIAAADLALLFRVRGRIQPAPVELLVLSACETAAGDELAILGLAGTAYRAGARSVIASLWTLDDAPTVSFAGTFYENLGQANISKAEALRRAQLTLAENPKFQHPRYWSTYVLAGNWL